MTDRALVAQGIEAVPASFDWRPNLGKTVPSRRPQMCPPRRADCRPARGPDRLRFATIEWPAGTFKSTPDSLTDRAHVAREIEAAPARLGWRSTSRETVPDRPSPTCPPRHADCRLPRRPDRLRFATIEWPTGTLKPTSDFATERVHVPLGSRPCPRASIGARISAKPSPADGRRCVRRGTPTVACRGDQIGSDSRRSSGQRGPSNRRRISRRIEYTSP